MKISVALKIQMAPQVNPLRPQHETRGPTKLDVKCDSLH